MNTSQDQLAGLSPEARDLFLALVADAGNWSGSPLFGGNVGGSMESRGHLTKLKKAGLVTTEVDADNRKLSWVFFTDKGKQAARDRGNKQSYFQ